MSKTFKINKQELGNENYIHPHDHDYKWIEQKKLEHSAHKKLKRAKKSQVLESHHVETRIWPLTDERNNKKGPKI